MDDKIGYCWRGELDDNELVVLTESHGGHAQRGWWHRIQGHSLGWVTARRTDGALVGFANVAWDGSDHAFLLDPKVRPDHQRRGIATEMVRQATDHASQAGCAWLHVDFAPHLKDFYLGACGFIPTNAGLIALD